jgi:hypothetical protein
MLDTRSFSASTSMWASVSPSPMPSERLMNEMRAAGGDHRLRRDAVEQVRRATDDVALDHRDLRAEASRVGGGLLPAGPPPMITRRFGMA